MKTNNEVDQWGSHSISYWMTAIIAVGIILVGVRFILDPIGRAEDFGLRHLHMTDIPFGRIKGVRDIFSGLAILPLLIFRMRRAAAWVFTAAIFIPVGDCLTILAANGPSDLPHLLMHGLTAVYMAITSVLLFGRKCQNAQL